LRPASTPSGTPISRENRRPASASSRGRRQALQDDLDGGRVVDEGAAEVAAQRVQDEDAELLDERPVEAEALGDRGPLLLVRVRVRQDVDGIADGVDGEEHQRRHHGDDEEGLAEAPDQVDEHGSSLPSPLCGGGTACRRQAGRGGVPE
jgi:hypothetical protein